MSEANEVKIGIIGAGGRGHLAHSAHKPKEGVRLVAAADVMDAPLNAFRDRFGEEAFVTKDYRELLERAEVDAVFVTSPDFLHEEHAVAALEAGKAVYLEKPMAITIEGCDRILETAYRSRQKLYLGHNMRHNQVIRKMKEVVDSGTVGEPKTAWCRHFVAYGGDAYFKDWHADRSKSTGLLLQKAAHDLDVLHWLCSGYTQRVVGMGGLTVYDQITERHAPSERGNATFVTENWPPLSQRGMNPVMDVEDVSMMLMQYDNGIFASYEQCHFTPDAWRNYTVIGTEGRVENFGDGSDAIVKVWTNRDDNYIAQGDLEFGFQAAGGGHGGSDIRIVEEFVRYVRDGGPITTSPIAARYAVAAGYLATKSLRSGNTPQDVPPVPGRVREYFRSQVRGGV